MTEELLMDDIFNWLNLQEATDAVERNKGAAGIDGRNIAETKAHLNVHWPEIDAKLRAGKYVPSPVMGVMIPKADGGERRLGIPTVQDRIIQQAIQQVLQTKFNGGFSHFSYGYRPHLSAHRAIEQAQRLVQAGKDWVVDIDISAFFDEVNHDILMYQIEQKINDKRVLGLIRTYLKTPIVIKGEIQKRSKGVPQGSPLSPLLANIYLDKLDKELEKRELSFCRYADDVVIFVSSERSAQRVLASLSTWIETHLKLRVNPTKSGTGRPWESQFLGFRITRKHHIVVAPKAIDKFKGNVRKLWNARQSLTSKALVQQWQRYSRGWWNYFKRAIDWHVKRWEGWVRRHIRKCFWQRWHNRKGRLKALQRLGVSPELQKTASSSRGAWRIAKSPAMHRALSNGTLRAYKIYMPSEFGVA